MCRPFTIVHTELDDIPLIFQFFEHSINYQETNGYPVWRNYDQGAIRRDIMERNQYKVVHDGKVGIVFSVGYSDKIIWREMDKSDAVYLHRIVVNPEFKGQKLFSNIVEWAKDHIRERGLRPIRMDTWAINTNLINYYRQFGFRIVETYETPDTPELPVHNRRLALTLMEYQHD